MSDNSFPLAKDELLQVYRTMRTIREFEERLHTEFAKGGIPGFVHLYAGEEAVATGVMTHLTDIDRIASTHRGHGPGRAHGRAHPGRRTGADSAGRFHHPPRHSPPPADAPPSR